MRSANNNSDFSKGKLSSTILRISLPIILAELVHVLYNLVDRMYIGHMGEDGTAAITGMGIVFPVITLISGFSGLCGGAGGAPLASIARGEGDNEKATRIMETSFTLLLLCGAFLTAVLLAFAEPILTVLGGDEETLPFALDYYRIYIAGTIPVLISLGMNPFINSQGFSRIGMLTVIIGAALNIVLDPILIFTLQMGVRGAALATVISQLVSSVWVIGFLRSRRPVMRLRTLRLEPPLIQSILKLGVTGFTFRVTNSITQAVTNVTLKAWGGELSTLYVGAMSVINSLREVATLPTSGLVSGAQPVISFNYGAKEYERVRKSIMFTFFFALSINTAFWLLLMVLPAPFIRIFTDDPELVGVTKNCLRVFFGVFPLMTMQSVGQNTFVALNYPKHALFFSLFRKIVLILPLTILLPRVGLGVMGPFWAEFFSQLFGATACFTTMCLTVFRKMKRLAQEKGAD